MSDETTTEETRADGRVGFRDIYRAVNESEARIKEHISLVLLPISATIADHEIRIRTIETDGSQEARDALAATVVLDGRVSTVEKHIAADVNAGLERRRIGDLSTRTLAALILVSNFIIGVIVAVANLLT